MIIKYNFDYVPYTNIYEKTNFWSDGKYQLIQELQLSRHKWEA